MMTRDQICNALVHLGHQAKYWGPDQSSYEALAAGWPAANGPLPTEAAMEEAAAAYRPVRPTILTYEKFQDRFTVEEFDAATGFVYEHDLTTGKPKRPAMVQAFARTLAKNRVDLLDARTTAFLNALVTVGILTPARKTEILAP